MSAITTKVLDDRLRAIVVTPVDVAMQENVAYRVARYSDAITKAPRLILTWHLLRLAFVALTDRSES